ncbi:PST family polysaccharide transporter [Lewinella marina]|uniref:Colanic acid exporter n=1 Tax=Neolewinella marina TaxID=438751 RepID=A0A2G0CBX2_9BACT|nr:MOP flippase family protein [Neolewinella marina]NJB86653.1 PST family polysaccharide transporter [Neolewinella marina]PHK97461.1 colanic acid exporter [Neolewinella marina]
MSNPFRSKTISGLKWNAVSRGVVQVTTIVLGIVLARLLSPSEFGLVAMVTVLTGFGTVFVDFGFTSAIIQNKNSDQRHWSSVFWLNLTVSVLIAIVLSVSAPLIARFYQEPELRLVTVVIAWTFVFQSFNLVQEALLRKRMEFKQLTLIRIVAQLVGGGVGIGAALSGLSYWSLVAKEYATIFCTNLGIWLVSSWRPGFILERSAIREMMSFSLPLMGSQTLNYWTRNADNLMVGKVLGESALGVYSRAYTLMLLPLSNISNVISGVMFPAYSQIQDEKERIKRIYLRITRVIGYLTFPMMFGLCVVAEPFIALLLGPQWMGVVPVIEILAPLGAVQSISTLEGNIFLSQGATRLQFVTGVISKVVMVASMAVGLYLGDLTGIAWAYLISSTTVAFAMFHYMGKLIDLSLYEICRNLFPMFMAAVTMALAVWLLDYVYLHNWPDLARLLSLVLSGAGAYLLLSFVFGLDELAYLYRILRER